MIFLSCISHSQLKVTDSLNQFMYINVFLNVFVCIEKAQCMYFRRSSCNWGHKKKTKLVNSSIGYKSNILLLDGTLHLFSGINEQFVLNFINFMITEIQIPTYQNFSRCLKANRFISSSILTLRHWEAICLAWQVMTGIKPRSHL